MNPCYDCGTVTLLYSVTTARDGKTMSIALCPECFKKETGGYPDQGRLNRNEQ